MASNIIGARILARPALGRPAPAVASPPETPSDEDALAPARGIVHGLLGSAVLWAAILAVYLLR